MKILTAAQMREVDRQTVELGIPSILLMENAGHRVIEFLAERFGPLEHHRILILCGKGNNGGDGLVVARQLYTRFRPKALQVVLAAPADEFTGDAAINLRMLKSVGCPADYLVAPEMRAATLIVDALLGTGLNGPARGRAAELIAEINSGFPVAKVVSVDLPSGLASDLADLPEMSVRADATVTFTAPKPCHVLWPACQQVGELRIGAIGTPPAMYQDDPSIWLSLLGPEAFGHLFRPRSRDANKGSYGHALVVAGGLGKTGAAAMAGMSALRMGAGLVTVASAVSAMPQLAAFAPELMTAPLPETADGQIRDLPPALLTRKNVAALGPGMGTGQETVQLIRRLADELDIATVIDADGLNAIAGTVLRAKRARVLTPHPGEMARLAGMTTESVQANRLNLARTFAREHGVYLVLKGNRTVIAFPNGAVWINPTGSPAMATAGTGDVLTGMITGLIAQFPCDLESAVLAAVYLHGRAGELGARALGEKSLIATDLLKFLPEAIGELSQISN